MTISDALLFVVVVVVALGGSMSGRLNASVRLNRPKSVGKQSIPLGGAFGVNQNHSRWYLLVSVATTAAGMFAQPVQSFVASHPVAGILAAGVGSVVGVLLPSALRPQS